MRAPVGGSAPPLFPEFLIQALCEVSKALGRPSQQLVFGS
jgi:hypothetical protein